MLASATTTAVISHLKTLVLLCPGEHTQHAAVFSQRRSAAYPRARRLPPALGRHAGGGRGSHGGAGAAGGALPERRRRGGRLRAQPDHRPAQPSRLRAESLHEGRFGDDQGFLFK